MFGIPGFAKKQRTADESAKMDRLERAETASAAVRKRALTVHQILDARQQRNHWREAIEQMIQGAH